MIWWTLCTPEPTRWAAAGTQGGDEWEVLMHSDCSGDLALWQLAQHSCSTLGPHLFSLLRYLWLTFSFLHFGISPCASHAEDCILLPLLTSSYDPALVLFLFSYTHTCSAFPKPVLTETAAAHCSYFPRYLPHTASDGKIIIPALRKAQLFFVSQCFFKSWHRKSAWYIFVDTASWMQKIDYKRMSIP